MGYTAREYFEILLEEARKEGPASGIPADEGTLEYLFFVMELQEAASDAARADAFVRALNKHLANDNPVPPFSTYGSGFYARVLGNLLPVLEDKLGRRITEAEFASSAQLVTTVMGIGLNMGWLAATTGFQGEE